MGKHTVFKAEFNKNATPKKIPLYVASASLNAKYEIHFNDRNQTSNLLEAQDIHAQLAAAEHGYRSKYNSMYKKGSIEKTNIVVGEIGFLYAKESLEEGEFGDELEYEHFPITVPNSTKYTFNVVDFWDPKENFYRKDIRPNKGKRNKIFEHHLQSRVRKFDKEIFEDNFLNNAAYMAGNIGTKSNQGNFPELFHHSEQALMEFLESTSGLAYIAKSLKELGAQTLGGVVLDLYSTRILCENCNINLIGLQNTQENGFLNNLEEVLNSSEYRIKSPKKGISWSTRVSANSTTNGAKIDSLLKANDKENIHTLSSNNRNIILQAKESNLGLKEIIEEKEYSLDSFSGYFFTSRITDKQKMETALGNRSCFK